MPPPDPELPLDGPLWRFAHARLRPARRGPGLPGAAAALRRRRQPAAVRRLARGRARRGPVRPAVAAGAAPRRRLARGHRPAAARRPPTHEDRAGAGPVRRDRGAARCAEGGRDRQRADRARGAGDPGPRGAAGPPRPDLDAIVRSNLRTVLALSAREDLFAEAGRPVRAIARAALDVTEEAMPCAG